MSAGLAALSVAPASASRLIVVEKSPDSAGTAFGYYAETYCGPTHVRHELAPFKLIDGQSKAFDFPGCGVDVWEGQVPVYFGAWVNHRRALYEWVEGFSCVPPDPLSIAVRPLVVSVSWFFGGTERTCTITHAPQGGRPLGSQDSCEVTDRHGQFIPKPLDANLARVVRGLPIKPPDVPCWQPSDRIDIAAGPRGYLFLALGRGLLAKYSIAERRIVKRVWVRSSVRQPGEEPFLSEATRDAAGTLIAPTDDGLMRISPAGIVSLERVPRATPWNLVPRPEGVYAGSRAGGGVNLIRRGRVIRRWSKYQNVSNVTDLTEGLDGRPWVSTIKGIASLPRRGLAKLIDPHTGRKSRGLGGWTDSIARSGNRVYFTSGSQIGWLDRAMRPHAGCRLRRPYAVSALRLVAPGLLSGQLIRRSTQLRYTVVLSQASHRVYAVKWPRPHAFGFALDRRGRAWAAWGRRLYQIDLSKPDKRLCRLR